VTLARTWSVGLAGVHGAMVEVEVDMAAGVPQVVLVGLPDAVVRQSVDRVRAAVVNAGGDFPLRRITIGLSPAAMPKQGSGFDLALAAGILAANGAIPADSVDRLVLLGELGLDGSVRGIRGVLPAVLAAARAGHLQVIVPAANAEEAALVESVEVLAAHTLADVVAHLGGRVALPRHVRGALPDPPAVPDLGDVVGQASGRRAVEVAAAGGHHLFLTGPPGAGKTMLAERLPGLLPPLDSAAALEVTAVHSVAGILPPGTPLVTRPPFQAPHHNASVPAIVGGGSSQVRPGAASLAHRGVLFLDEAPEFAPAVLDALRQPLESGEITVSRLVAQVRFPARFQLVLAANPCPCGLAVGKGTDCRCSPMAKLRYLGRLSGPLLDRVDLSLEMLAATRAELREDSAHVEDTATVAGRVVAARERMVARLAATPWRANAEVPGHVLRRHWPLPWAVVAAAEQELDRGGLTARGVDRVLRVAWTLSDLAGRERPDAGDVHVALQFRGVRRWAA
jgi:magnesium chelatase family protein